MPMTLKYSELRDRLYDPTKINSLESNLITRMKYKLDCECLPACLMDNDDVRFLLLELDHNRPPRFISVEEIHQKTTLDDTRIVHEPMCGVNINNELDTFPLVVSMENDNMNPWDHILTNIILAGRGVVMRLLRPWKRLGMTLVSRML